MRASTGDQCHLAVREVCRLDPFSRASGVTSGESRKRDEEVCAGFVQQQRLERTGRRSREVLGNRQEIPPRTFSDSG